MHVSCPHRGLCSMWASRNALRNRRFGNYCENCAQEEVKPTEFHEEPLLPTTQSSPCGQSLVVPDSSTQMQRLEPHSLKGVKCVPPLPCGFRVAHTESHKPSRHFLAQTPAGLGLETPLFYNPTPQAHNPPSFHLITLQT